MLTKEQRELCNAWPMPWQVSVLCLSNAMASVCALPVKCHEPAVMALASSVVSGPVAADFYDAVFAYFGA
jgi:hypothetical protein